MTIEIEAKFTVPDRLVWQRLLSLEHLAGMVPAGWIRHLITDVYLDTATRALQAGGYACRLRQEDQGSRLMLKAIVRAPGAIQHRQEFEVRSVAGTDPLQPASWPAGAARDLLRTLAGEQTLQQLFIIEQERLVCRLLAGERPAIELSLDRSRIGSGPPLLELEAELLPAGQESELERLVRVLVEEWGLVPQAQSKYERGLARLALLTRAYPDIKTCDPMSEAGRKILQLQLERMLANEAGTRAGADIEALHDMRVATRRMRAALRVSAPYFEPAVIRPLRKGLKRIGRALGAVRDLDVFVEKAHRYRDSLPHEQLHTLDALLAACDERRDRARTQMLFYLDSERYLRFITQMGHFVATPGAGIASPPAGKPTPFLVQHVAPRLIYTRYEEVRAYGPHMVGASLELLHALRVDFKRLRYALEFFSPVLGAQARPVIDETKIIQDHLGDLNDAAVAIRLLDELGLHAPGVLEYRHFRLAEMNHLRQNWPAAWARFERPEIRHHLAQAVAAL